MEKPQPRQYNYYDYGACRDYLQERDHYDERDYARKWEHPPKSLHPYQGNDIPSQDFWHFVCDQEPGLRNDSVFTMCDGWGEGAQPWQQEILEKYLSTFGARDPHTGERFIKFYVSW